jgi:hypothetical protein
MDHSQDNLLFSTIKLKNDDKNSSVEQINEKEFENYKMNGFKTEIKRSAEDRLESYLGK